MEFKKSIFVKSADEFPNWKAPCPKCGGENCISTRKDKLVLGARSVVKTGK